MKTVIHGATSRGHINYGWLDTKHTFSFSNYYDPERIHFGALRVLNDDIIAGGFGFDTHPHDNMEIISVPVYGALEHKDSMGNIHVIHDNEIQNMSAGSGITHSEYNHDTLNDLNFLQIWILPKLKNIKPRYEQKVFHEANRMDQFQLIVSPEKDSGALWINQDAWLSLANPSSGKDLTYTTHLSGNGVYIFVIAGEISVSSEIITNRDGIGIWDVDTFEIRTLQDSRLLIIEVPMK